MSSASGPLPSAPSAPSAPTATPDVPAPIPPASSAEPAHDTHPAQTSPPQTSPPQPAPVDSGALQPVTHLEPDSGSDTDSAFGDTNSSASTSLASSILNYEYSNGRRYHGFRSGAYLLPNDEQEQDRLDLLHHIFNMILNGKLYDAPIDSPRRALDIGTGTGIWLIDFADEHPECEVLGTDLSPIQPTWVPPNAKFYIDDVESDWVYSPDEYFDYIHVRTLSGAISDWDRLIQQCYANMQPGGWLEFQEPVALCESDDGTIDTAHAMQRWQDLCNDAAKSFAKEIRVGHTLAQRMRDAGFVDVAEKIVKVPIGPWPRDPRMKEIGRYQREHMAMGIEPYTLGFVGKLLGWSEEECRVLIAQVTSDVRRRDVHMYIKFYFVHGRKPQSAQH